MTPSLQRANLRELASRLLAGDIPTCNTPACERQEMFPADALVRVVRCSRCKCEVPMQPEWEHLELKKAAYLGVFGAGFDDDPEERVARCALVLCIFREVGRSTAEARMNLAEALGITEPPGCVHSPGIPTPNRPWASRACRKCGRLLNLNSNLNERGSHG